MSSPIGTEIPAEMLDRITGQPNNRRSQERRTYRVMQWIAACAEVGLPELNAFRQVRCYDISRGGVSFYTDRPPLDEMLVIGLGIGAQTIYLKCRVANCVRVDELSGAFRIGCEFICRIELPSASQPSSPTNAKAGAAS